jgi:hypothetical protein
MIRLLHAKHLHFEEFFDDDVPDYVILSHRWFSQREELTYRDFLDGRKRESKGWTKITALCEKALSHKYEWVWIDTCCIDKTSSAELTEAINSAFRWCQNAKECYVYLYDVSWNDRRLYSTDSLLFTSEEQPRELGSPASRQSFRGSDWHTRSWALQDLLAPPEVIFYDHNWRYIGRRETLAADIASATGIEIKYLLGSSLHEASAATKLRWAARRKCSRVEDQSYCLLGIFDLNMPLVYGEGNNAFLRLQQEIWKKTSDKSLFTWMTREGKRGKAPPPGASWREISAAFAPSPAAFWYNLDPNTAGGESDDLASTMSADSRASTATGSSATLVGEALAAAEEFVEILRGDRNLNPIFSTAVNNVTLEELKRKIQELLKIYSIDLQQEASNGLQKEAVALVRRRRAYIAYRICQSYDTSAGIYEDQFARIIQQNPDSHARLEEYAKKMSRADVEYEPMKLLESVDTGDRLDSGPPSEDEPERLEPTDLDRVKAFMIESAAYERLIQNFRDFITSYGKSEQTIRRRPFTQSLLSVHVWRRLQVKGFEIMQSMKMLCRPMVPTGCERITWICVSCIVYTF